MTKNTPILLHILLLVLFLYASYLFDSKAVEIHGPTRLVQGPGDTLYVLTDDRIIKVSKDGEVLTTLNLEESGITEPVADLFVEPDGKIMIGFMESQLIKRYTGDGKVISTHSRPPSLMTNRGRNFKFTEDPRSGMLYVADSTHHRIQIYGPDERQMRELSSPSGNGAENAQSNTHHSSQEQDVPFLFPNALAIDRDRSYATDTDNHRIVVFGLDGAFQRIMPTARHSGVLTGYTFPVRFARTDNTLYVINRGPHFIGGEIIAMELDGSRPRPFYSRDAGIDPLDILAREDDILIVDAESKHILSYYPDGVYRGYFGKPSLLNELSKIAFRRNTYRVLRIYSFAGLFGVLVSLLLLKRKDRADREKLGLPSVHQPVKAFQTN